MNVTAVNQIVANTKASKKTELNDGSAFSQELKKQLTHAEESEADELTDDLSQSEVKSEVEEDTDKMEETSEFVIIPAFLRFDSKLEHASTVLTDLHKDQLDMASTIARETNLTPLAIDEEAIISMTDLSESFQALETVKVSTEPVLTTAVSGKETAELTPDSEIKNASMADTEFLPATDANDLPEGLIKENFSVNLSKAAIEGETGRVSLEKAEEMTMTVKDSKPVIGDSAKETAPAIENKLTQSSTPQTEANGQNERPSSFEAINFQAGQQSEELSKPTVTEQSVNLKDNSAEEQLVEQFGLSQSTQLKTVPDTVNQTIPLPVKTALEQSPEVIQDMMMSVSSNEAGETVYQSTLTLTPETLGDIKVELSYSDEKLTGNFIFETEDAKQHIESHWQQIKGPLEMKGLQLNGFEFQVVDPHTSAQSGNLNFSQQSDQSKKDQQDEQRKSAQSSDRFEEETAGANLVTRQESGLNYYA
ncbi:hypothetical protein GCM10008929_14170 [Alkalibacterium psychrotolerans]